jgi:GNAT superfamily N-acetyltransferase
VIELHRAIQAFGEGFSTHRSLTHPFEFVSLGPLWVLRDATPRRDPRLQEILVHGVAPHEAVRILREYDPPRAFLCVIEDMDADHDGLKRQYKELGYRLLGSEPFFVGDVRSEVQTPTFPVARVMEWALAERVNKAARKQILPVHLESDDAKVRLYVALDGEEPIGWVRSVSCGRDTFVLGLFVERSHRRKGIGRSLMLAMLLDDQRLGYEHSVLLASTAGSYLYPQIGYQQIGLLQLFCQNRKK